jgi:hypothetical protein
MARLVALGFTLVLLGACSFSPGNGITPIDSAPTIDAPPVLPDASACTGASAECANADTLRTCAGDTATPVDTACAWGCIAAGGAHCSELAPAGGAVSVADLAPNGLDDITLTGNTIDTTSGTITGVTTGFEFHVTKNVAIFRFKSLTISGVVLLTGDRPVALVADGSISVDDLIDARGPCRAGFGRIAGPGGFDGGPNSTTATGQGGGRGGTNNDDGGGGGGYGSTGGAGAGGQTGGAAFGDPQISTLIGGGGGGGGKNDTGGGGGGGAIQLVSNRRITIGADPAGINAGGCGGIQSNGGPNDGGGGGGAGGTILLEAPSIAIAGSLAVNGGGGGGRVNGSGTAGRLDRTPASGGGGAGGPGGAGDGTLGGGTFVGAAGGGGGSVGRIRINTRSGNVNLMSGSSLSPSFNDPGTTATQAAATVN